MLFKLSRRRALQALGAAGSAAIVPSAVRAQTALVDKPVTILVGFTSGGGVDHVARVIAPRLQSRIGRRVRVENHAGANGSLVGESLKKAVPDGALIGCIPSNTLEARLTEPVPSFDPQADLAPLSLVGTHPMTLVVSPNVEASNLSQFADWLKDADKTRTRIGMAANDAFLELYVKLVGRELGTPLQGVSYRGGRPLVNDLRENKIPAGIVSLPSALESHRGGKLRIIVTSADKRLPIAPGLQTAFEFGRTNLVMTEWYGLFTSPRTPAPIVAELNMHIRAVLAEPEAAAEITNIGLTIRSSTPEELAAAVTASLKLWRDKMAAVGMPAPG